jgi:type I restriction enzyme R subunit
LNIGKNIQHPAMANPTLVVLTDRNDLDDQLYTTFFKCPACCGRRPSRRGIDLGLSKDELAFYDALEVNDSAVQVLGDETLKTIAQELVKAIRGNVTIDWTEREAVRAKLRVMVKRLLKKYGYPPDKQEKATQTVLQQAETLCKDWAA